MRLLPRHLRRVERGVQPLVGGTTKDDVKTGRVARLNDPAFPGRTTLMKVSTVATLWDYIRRAMPWTAPKSLSVDEVYAVTAFCSTSAASCPTTSCSAADHGAGPGAAAQPQRHHHRSCDVAGRQQRRQARRAGHVVHDEVRGRGTARLLPARLRANAHGNLAEQNRMVGAQHGNRHHPPAGSMPKAAPAAPAPRPRRRRPSGLLAKHGCTACHGSTRSWSARACARVAKKYAGRSMPRPTWRQDPRRRQRRVGAIPMPPQSLAEADAQSIAQWLAEGARK